MIFALPFFYVLGVIHYMAFRFAEFRLDYDFAKILNTVKSFYLGMFFGIAMVLVPTHPKVSWALFAFLTGFITLPVIAQVIIHWDEIKFFVSNLRNREHVLVWSSEDHTGTEHWRCRLCRKSFRVPVNRSKKFVFEHMIFLGYITHVVPLTRDYEFWEEILEGWDLETTAKFKELE